MKLSKLTILVTTICLLTFLLSPAVQADDNTKVRIGSIKGRVIDAVSQAPIPGASVLVVGTQQGAATDDAGSFKISGLPVGTYSLTIRSVAYEPQSRSDIIVRSKRITFVEAELVPTTTEIEGMTVTAGYFVDKPDQPTSTTDFTGEEIRRSPGTAGDVSRIVATLPSIAKVNDQQNSLIVRGVRRPKTHSTSTISRYRTSTTIRYRDHRAVRSVCSTLTSSRTCRSPPVVFPPPTATGCRQ